MTEMLTLPVVPMRNSALLPGVSLPIAAGRPGTLRAIEAALKDPERRVFAVAQRQDGDDVAPERPLHDRHDRDARTPSSGGSAVSVWSSRASPAASRCASSPRKGYLEASVSEAGRDAARSTTRDPAFVALHREARERAAELGRKMGLPNEAIEQILAEVDEPGRLADVVAGYIDITIAERQSLLETLSVEDRLRRVLVHVQRQIDVLSAQEDIQSKVKEEIGSRQREVYLREQMRAIQKELGEGEGAQDEALKELRAKLDTLDAPRRGPQGSRPRVAAAHPDRPRVGRVAGDPHVPRDDRGAAVEQAQRRAPRRPDGVAGPRRRTTTG